MYLRQQLCAPNDRNGNPRRAWVLFEADEAERRVFVVATRDEGYAGDPANLWHEGVNIWRQAVKLPSVNVSADEYRRFVGGGRVLD